MNDVWDCGVFGFWTVRCRCLYKSRYKKKQQTFSSFYSLLPVFPPLLSHPPSLFPSLPTFFHLHAVSTHIIHTHTPIFRDYYYSIYSPTFFNDKWFFLNLPTSLVSLLKRINHALNKQMVVLNNATYLKAMMKEKPESASVFVIDSVLLFWRLV